MIWDEDSLLPMFWIVPVGVPSCVMPVVQHFPGGKEVMLSDV